MSFSRAYLNGIPVENKKKEVDDIIEQFIEPLRIVAGNGQKSYFYVIMRTIYELPIPNPYVKMVMLKNEMISTCKIPIKEQVPLIKERFPDCSVKYHEEWESVVINENIRVLKKGIRIDWS